MAVNVIAVEVSGLLDALVSVRRPEIEYIAPGAADVDGDIDKATEVACFTVL